MQIEKQRKYSSVTVRRRYLLTLGGAALAAPFILRSGLAQGAWPEQTTIPDILKGSGEVRIAGYGGTVQEAQQKAQFQPFEKATGIKVRDFPGADWAKVKAMVDTGNVGWDVVHLGHANAIDLMKTGDYLEKIDYSLIDDGVRREYRFEYDLGMMVHAQVMGYRTDAFRGATPASWADFWDIQKFPGDRAMYGVGPAYPELEFALMAAGVPPDKLYPLDIDKALASYDKIKKSVVKWWTTGAQPTQMLTDREVVMATVYGHRMAALQEQGVPVAISWNQGVAKFDTWGIPRGARNKVNAMKFVAYTTMPIPQARFALAIPVGPVNEAAQKYIPPQRLVVLPSAPEIKKQVVPYNYEWWAANRERAAAKFTKWLLG
ncbi:putative spermidine/putrescine transport system substrate-binding protein [Bradyrhizobium macuxiense]|uniref:Putative spermidine/putrescine transport system substrate-binding protein n=2 Tax=Bradyrhizobium macuxiense TaxID=1755647 RepID=A0A560KRV6_9BRAD|nr:putative spermidine/putrescine transport system substrate-binding protein [Bradyrhizobium macuxiense]